MHRPLFALTLSRACVASAREDEKPAEIEGSSDHPAAKRSPGVIITELSKP